MINERVRRAFDKIRIDANSAVTIWKNILTIEAAYDAYMAAHPAEAGEERAPAAEEAPLVPAEAVFEQAAPEETDVPEEPAPERADEYPADEVSEGYPSDGETGEAPEDAAEDAPETEAPFDDAAEDDDVKIYSGSDSAAASEAEAEEDYAGEEDGYASADGEIDWSTIGEELAENDWAGDAAYAAADSEADYDDAYYDEDEPSRRVRAGHARKRRNSRFAVFLIIFGLVIIAAAVFLIMRSRSNADAAKSGGESAGGLSSGISVPVVTEPPLVLEGPKESVDKLAQVTAAMQEWNEYKKASRREYIEAHLPEFAAFLENDDYFDGTDIIENGDETYSFVHWKYDRDWGNVSTDPVTGVEEPALIQKFDYENSVTVEKAAFDAYNAYCANRENEGNYSDYHYSYGVGNEADKQKLEEIAAKYSLSLRDEGESHGFGEAEDAELSRALSEKICSSDSLYKNTPQIDYYTCYDSGAFEVMAEIPLYDGRRMFTLCCGAPYSEMIDLIAANAISKQNGAMETREYTASDGTALTVSYNEKQAIVYAYLENCYVVMDMGINTWRQTPEAEDSEEARAAKMETDLTLNEEVVNYVCNFMGFANLK